MTIAEMEDRVADLKAELAELRYLIRKKTAPARLPVNRTRRVQDERVAEIFGQEGGGAYGSLKRTAARLAISERQTSRVLARLGLGHFRTKFR
jgi:hypothetical protein